jgi:2-methylcitrate dehydratase PrpD
MKQEVTDRLAQWAIATKYDALPAAVKDAATRTLLNFVGCTLGGCRHPAVETAFAAVQPFAGPGQARLLGRRERVDLLNAALINCMGSAVHTFDDTHLKSISHPGGPVAAAITAIAEQRRLKGTDFLAALVVGVEVACRLASMLTVPPARSNVSLFMTGITGGIAAAVAAAKLLGLDSLGMKHAIGVAAAQAAGIRETHGTMASSFVPANASRAGLFSAFLAEKGFTSGTRGIEGTKGFANVFGVPANLNALIDGLGSDFELLLNLSKPYPCGVLIHPAIDACLEIVKSHQAQRSPGCRRAHRPTRSGQLAGGSGQHLSLGGGDLRPRRRRNSRRLRSGGFRSGNRFASPAYNTEGRSRDGRRGHHRDRKAR